LAEPDVCILTSDNPGKDDQGREEEEEEVKGGDSGLEYIAGIGKANVNALAN
jgi:hypothetical protein